MSSFYPDSLIIYNIYEFIDSGHLALRFVFRENVTSAIINKLRIIEGNPEDSYQEKEIKYLMSAADILCITPTVIKWMIIRWKDYASLRQLSYMWTKYNIRLQSKIIRDIIDKTGIYGTNCLTRLLHATMIGFYGEKGGSDDLRITSLPLLVTEQYVHELLSYTSFDDIESDLYGPSVVAENLSVIDKVINDDYYNINIADEYEGLSCINVYPKSQIIPQDTHTQKVPFYNCFMLDNEDVCVYNDCYNRVIVSKKFSRGMNNKKAKRYAYWIIKNTRGISNTCKYFTGIGSTWNVKNPYLFVDEHPRKIVGLNFKYNLQNMENMITNEDIIGFVRKLLIICSGFYYTEHTKAINNTLNECRKFIDRVFGQDSAYLILQRK